MLRFRTIALLAAALSTSIAQLVACSSGDAADELVAPVQVTGGNAGSAGEGQDSSMAGQAGGKQDAPDPVEASAPLQPRLAVELAVREVSVFQAVKIPLARDGSPIAQRNAPVLAGRKTVFRIHIEPSESFTERFITAEVRLSTAGAEPLSFSSGMKVFGPSTDDIVGSAFDVQVPAEEVTTDTKWSVRLVDETAQMVEEGAAHTARFPLDGSMVSLDARSDGPGLQLVLVPFRYDTDGSGRLPDTSDAQLEVFRGLLTAVYPLVHTQLTVHAPVVWTEPLWFGDVNFNTVNERLFDLKQEDGAPGQSYYFGLISPAASLDDYCKFTCVTGQSYVVDEASSGDYRVGAGMGFTGESSAWTLVHELGHLHGRLHAPCDVNQWDSNYPYDSGGTGVWGWDARNGVFQDPKVAYDLMGYCEPAWVSDYTFSGLFDRVLEVGSLRSLGSPSRSPHRFLRVSVDGTAQWGRDVLAAGKGEGDAIVRYVGPKGTLIAELRSRAVRQSRGGYSVLVPRIAGEVTTVQIAGDVPENAALAW